MRTWLSCEAISHLQRKMPWRARTLRSHESQQSALLGEPSAGANAARLAKARLDSPISPALEVVAYEFEED